MVQAQAMTSRAGILHVHGDVDWVLADPANHIVTLQGPRDWTTHEVTAPIPDDANTVAFGLFLAGPGRIELRNPELTRAGLPY